MTDGVLILEDNGNNLTLDADGANIPIAVAGSYKITTDFNAKRLV
jgi:hypothetical protein